MPTARELSSRVPLEELSSSTGISKDRLASLSEGKDASMAELRLLGQAFSHGCTGFAASGSKAKAADLLFRQAGAGADESTFATCPYASVTRWSL